MLDKFWNSAIGTYLRHNPGLAVALVACMTFTGCAYFPFKTESPLDSKIHITRTQLNAEIASFDAKIKAEVDAFYAKAKAADQSLDAKETFATAGINTLTQLVQQSGLPIPAAAGTIFAMLAGGLSYDNRRKDTLLALEKNKGAANG